MLITIDDIADMEQMLAIAESSIAIATDCLNRGYEALAHINEVIDKGKAVPFHITATDK